MWSYGLIKKLLNLRVDKEEGLGRERTVMWNNMDQNGNQGLAGTIAVAVDDGVASQNALKWAIEHILHRYNHHVPIKLVHVINPSNSNSAPHTPGTNTMNEGQAHDASNMEFLLPFRCYCMRKRVQCETVILEDEDVIEALIEYIAHNGIERIVVGAAAKAGFTRRIFKGTYESVPAKLLKLAPHFCSVYIIQRGKIQELREASRPVPNIPAADERAAEPYNIAPSNNSYDEVSVAENDMSFASSGRPSTDSMACSFYQNFGSAGMTTQVIPSESSDLESIAKLESDFNSLDFGTDLYEPISSSTAQHTGGITPFLSNRVLFGISVAHLQEDMEDEMKRLRVELKQTIDMYHAACKEAVAAKQKAMELEECKMKEERRLEETRLALEATMAAMQKEKANFKATFLAADEAADHQRFADQREVQTAINADQIFKALREVDDEEKKKVLEALCQSHLHIVSKYQSLVHILVVLFLLSFYFSLFRELVSTRFRIWPFPAFH